jgi:hypothetical protein
MSVNVEKQKRREKNLFSAKANFGSRYTLGEAVCNHVPRGNQYNVGQQVSLLV